MTKRFATFLLIVNVVFCWGFAQGSRSELFDSKKAQQELEIMKGILGTTLSFVAKELRASAHPSYEGKPQAKSVWGGLSKFSNISAFYLVGQGAVFIIPVSHLRFTIQEGRLLGDEIKLPDEVELDEMASQGLMMDTDWTEALKSNLFEADLAFLMDGIHEGVIGGIPGGVPGGVLGGIVGGVPGGVEGGVPGRIGSSGRAKDARKVKIEARPKRLQAQAPAPAAAPRPPGDKDEMRKRLEDAQSKLLKRREDVELKRKQFLEHLAQIKVHLIEALANHGDSLTHVKPNEYVTLILAAGDEDNLFLDPEGTRTGREIISVQKSIISEYKTGRLTLEAFKQRVLQYSN